MKKLAIIALAAIAGASQAVELYNNGGFITGTNGSGAPISALTAPSSIFGFGVQQSAGNRMADDFTATNNWTLEGFRIFSYQTGATGFTLTNVSWDIVAGDVNTGSVVASGAGAPTNGGLQAYRVASTTPDATNRPIFALDMTGLNVALTSGQNYWLRWSIAGSLTSGPWAPPVVPGPANGGNAAQSLTGGTFNPAMDAGSGLVAEMPFVLNGVVPEPGTMIALGAGIAAIAARRRRK